MLKRLLASQLRINMASSVVTNGINVVLLAVAYPVYLHYLGYEAYGLWLALGVVMAFAQMSDLGMAQAVTKLAAEELGRGNKQAIQQYTATALLILCMAGGIVLTAIVAFKSQIVSAFKFTGEIRQIAEVLLPYMVLLSIYVLVVQVLRATLAGLGRMDLSNYIETGGRIVLVSVAITLLCFGQGLKSLVFATAVSQFTMHVVSIVLIRRLVPFKLLRISNLRQTCSKRLLHIGIGLFGGSIVRMMGIPFNKFMLARYAGVDSLPIFDIAFRGTMQIRSAVEVAFRALMPEVSRTASKMSTAAISRIRSMMRRGQQIIFFGAVPLYVVLFFVAPALLKIWLGKSFVDSIPLTFRIVLFANFINLLSVLAYYFLIGLGKIRFVFIATCISWLSNAAVILIFALCLQRFSPAIAGVCLAISWTASTSYLIWSYRRVMYHYAKTTLSIEKQVLCYAS